MLPAALDVTLCSIVDSELAFRPSPTQRLPSPQQPQHRRLSGTPIRRRLLAHPLVLPWNQRAHTRITEEQTAPNEDSYVYRREYVAEQRIPNPRIRRHCASQIACQQDRTQH